MKLLQIITFIFNIILKHNIKYKIQNHAINEQSLKVFELG